MFGQSFQVTICAVLAIQIGLGIAQPLRAENPLDQLADGLSAESSTLESQAALVKWVEQLGASEFALRRQAFFELWRVGKSALPLISTAKASDQRPVAEAARVLEILVDLEIAPERLEESSRLLDVIGDPTPQTVLELCALKYWNVAGRMLAGNPELARRFKDAYGRYMLSRLVDAAVEQDQVALAWPIIRQVVLPPQAVWIAHKTGLPLERSDTYSTAQKLFYEGRIDEALAIKVPLVVQIPMLTRSGRWQRLTEEPIVSILAGRQVTPSQLAARAVLHEVAGDFAGATELWNEVLPLSNSNSHADSTIKEGEETADGDDRQNGGTALEEDERASQVKRAVGLLEAIDQDGAGGQANKNQLLAALIFSGRVVAIEQYLEAHSPTEAFGFYLAGNQQAQALEAIGIHSDLSNLDEWFLQRKGLIVEQLSQRAIDNRDFDLCARLCAILTDMGYRQRSQQLLDELVELAHLSRGQQVELWSRSLLPWLGRSETRQLAMQAAMREFPRMSSECQAAVLKGLFPEFEDAAVALWKTAPSENESSKWNDLQKLYVSNRAALGQDYRSTVEAWLRRAIGLLSNEQLVSDHLTTLATIASGFGESDLAIEILMTDLSPGFGQSASANLHWAAAARIFVERGKPEDALPLLSAVRRSGVNPQWAYVEEVHALMLNGQFEKARVMDQSRWLRPLSTVARFQGYNYFLAAREFVGEHQYNRAADVAEAAFLMADLGSIDLYWSAGVYGDVLEELKEPDRRADVLRAAWVEALQPFSSTMQTMIGDGYYSALRFSAQKEKLARAIACVEHDDWAGFRHTVAVARQLQSQDIEVVCQCYPLLRDKGQLELAEQLLEDYESEMRQQLERWPNDATALNNLAWMYSQCDLKLDQARELSRRAIELAPSSAIFLDTLAEIEFRSGDLDAAQQTMRECVRLDPRERHYRDNLVRFRKAK